MKTHQALIGMALAGCIAAAPVHAQASLDWWEWALPQALQGQVLETSQGYEVIVGDEAIQALAGIRDAEEETFRGSGDGVLEVSVPCRTQEGWPTFNKRKCRAEALQSERYTWDRALVGPSAFQDDAAGEPYLETDALRHILGDQEYRLIELEGQTRGLQGELTGRWITTEGSRARVLQIRADGKPLAELTDYDGDGYIDATLLHRGP